MGNLKEKNNIILKSLGHHLRLIRQEKQLRQKTVAKLCDMDSGSYSNIEKGKRNITIGTKKMPTLQLECMGLALGTRCRC